MFGRKKMKEDALKWRKHCETEVQKILDEKYELVVCVGLVDGEQVVIRKTFKGYSWTCWYGGETYTQTAEERATDYLINLKDRVSTVGVTVDDTFYLPHTISTITRQD